MHQHSDRSYSVTGFIVWGICALFFLYEFLLRTILGTFQQEIMGDLHLNSFKFSLLSTSMYLLIYGIMQIPVGLITNRYGLKKSLSTGAIICAVSAFGFAYSYNFYMALVFRLLTGLGSSFGFICLLVAVYDWMPRKNVALMIGLSQFVGTLGPMLAAGPLNALVEESSLSWRQTFVFFSLMGAIVTLAIVFFVKNSQDQEGSYIVLRNPARMKTNLKQLFLRKTPWCISLFSAFIYFTIEFLSENDGKHFLTLKGFSSGFSSYMLTLAWVGYAIGCPLLGFFSDLLDRRKNIMVFSSALAVLAAVGIVFGTDKHILMGAFFTLGLSASGQSVAFAAIADQFKAGYSAIGLALNNGVICTLSAINAPIISIVIDSTKSTDLPCHEDYQRVFYSLILIAFLALIFATLFIKETFGKSAVDFTFLNLRKKHYEKS